MFRYFVYPVFLLNEILSFSFLFFFFLSFDDYLPPCTTTPQAGIRGFSCRQ